MHLLAGMGSPGGGGGGGEGTSPPRKSNLSRRRLPTAQARAASMGEMSSVRSLPAPRPCLCQATCCSAHRVGLASPISSFTVQIHALYAALSCRCNISDGPGRCDWACAGDRLRGSSVQAGGTHRRGTCRPPVAGSRAPPARTAAPAPPQAGLFSRAALGGGPCRAPQLQLHPLACNAAPLCVLTEPGGCVIARRCWREEGRGGAAGEHAPPCSPGMLW